MGWWGAGEGRGPGPGSTGLSGQSPRLGVGSKSGNTRVECVSRSGVWLLCVGLGWEGGKAGPESSWGLCAWSGRALLVPGGQGFLAQAA